MDILLSLRQDLYMYGAQAIAHLQEAYPTIGEFLVPVSALGDPSKGFIVFFPLILSLNYLKGVKFLGAFIICEWFNMVAKWVLHGERPYWWVVEHSTNITLVQTRLTCETGPGVPSGHSQAAAVIWFCLVDTVTGCLGWGKLLGWVVFFFMQLSMLLSRIYIAAHFPHQCFLGFFVGLIIVKKFYLKATWVQYKTVPLVFMSMFLISSALGVYMLLLKFGVDPNWSIALAKKNCEKPEWIYVDTTPFYAMMRFSGSAVGLSLSGFLSMEVFSTPKVYTTGFAMILGLGLGQLSNMIHRNIPRGNLDQFYLCEFLLNAFFVITVIKMFQMILANNLCGNQRHFNRSHKS